MALVTGEWAGIPIGGCFGADAGPQSRQWLFHEVWFHWELRQHRHLCTSQGHGPQWLVWLNWCQLTADAAAVIDEAINWWMSVRSQSLLNLNGSCLTVSKMQHRQCTWRFCHGAPVTQMVDKTHRLIIFINFYVIVLSVVCSAKCCLNVFCPIILLPKHPTCMSLFSNITVVQITWVKNWRRTAEHAQ